MKIKVIQSIFVLGQGIVDTNRVIEVTEAQGKDLIEAKYAVLHKGEEVIPAKQTEEKVDEKPVVKKTTKRVVKKTTEDGE